MRREQKEELSEELLRLKRATSRGDVKDEVDGALRAIQDSALRAVLRHLDVILEALPPGSASWLAAQIAKKVQAAMQGGER